MIVLDTTIVNVALPSIRADLGFSETSLAWVVNAYMLTFGGFLLSAAGSATCTAGAAVSRRHHAVHTRFPRLRPLDVAGDARDSARRAGPRRRDCLRGRALADDESLHRAGRAREGDGRLRVRCAGGGSIGVLLGGVLTGALNWHWIFLVNLPIGVAVDLLSRRLLPGAQARRGRARLDVPAP